MVSFTKNWLRRFLCVCTALAVTTGFEGQASGADVSSFAGTWQFEFSGDDTGSGSATVSKIGALHGAGRSFGLDTTVTVTGQVSATGAMKFEATPAGGVSTGAVFTGIARGETASGSWENAALEGSGRWTARRISARDEASATPSTITEGVTCTLAGAPFITDNFRADFILDSTARDNHFRLIAGKNPVNDQPTYLHFKALGVTGPGTYAMSRKPTWLSVINLAGEDISVDNGKFTFTEMDPRGTKRVVGTLEAQAGGTRAVCRFAMYMTVVDMGAAKRGRPVE